MIMAIFQKSKISYSNCEIVRTENVGCPIPPEPPICPDCANSIPDTLLGRVTRAGYIYTGTLTRVIDPGFWGVWSGGLWNEELHEFAGLIVYFCNPSGIYLHAVFAYWAPMTCILSIDCEMGDCIISEGYALGVG